MDTFGTLFSGGEGAGMGLQAAGLRHCWGIEYDPAIAAVAQRNGFAVTVADVRAVDYTALAPVDWLHASPVCTRASNANPNATESPEDIETAAAVVRALDAIRPQVFTLENVWGYRNFQAFKHICEELGRSGYFWDFEHVNCADFGVPQTRKRLILRASRGLLPHLPQPVPWVGWYQAIEDLIPTLPESQLAPWQLARLPADLKTLLFSSNGNSESYGDHHVEAQEPALTVSPQAMGRARAVLVETQNAARDATAREEAQPASTVSYAVASRPSHQMAVLWSHGRSHDRQGNEYGPVLRESGEPAMTATANSGPYNASIGVRVVSMTPRALARFQSIPDSYKLPEKRTLAAKVIGNMVPPLLIQRLAENMKEAN